MGEGVQHGRGQRHDLHRHREGGEGDQRDTQARDGGHPPAERRLPAGADDGGRDHDDARRRQQPAQHERGDAVRHQQVDGHGQRGGGRDDHPSAISISFIPGRSAGRGATAAEDS